MQNVDCSYLPGNGRMAPTAFSYLVYDTGDTTEVAGILSVSWNLGGVGSFLHDGEGGEGGRRACCYCQAQTGENSSADSPQWTQNFFGAYYCECKANFARDFSKFLKRCCQGKNLPGGYHHDCSLEIFEEFERSPHEPLAPKCENLPKYNEEDEVVKRVYKKIHVDARNRIKEMLPRFIERVSTEKLGLLKSRNECCVTGSRNFASVSEAKEFLKVYYNDWVILADGVKDNGAKCIRRRCLAHYSAQSQVLDISLAIAKPCRTNPTDWAPISSEPMPDTMSLREPIPDTMSLREPMPDMMSLRESMPDTMSMRELLREPMPDMMSLLEARRYLDEHFRNEHWLILAECMTFCGLDTVALLQDSYWDQEC